MGNLFRFSLLVALGLPALAAEPVQISEEVHNACKDVKDYRGCVAIRSGEANQENAFPTRTSYQMKGKLKVLFNPAALTAVKVGDEWGRNLMWTYYTTLPPRSWHWIGEADCKDYTLKISNFHGIKYPQGWIKLNGSKAKKEPNQAQKKIVDEFCPQMDRLVKEAKERELSGKTFTAFQYPPANQVGNGTNTNRGKALQSLQNTVNLLQQQQMQQQIRTNQYNTLQNQNQIYMNQYRNQYGY